MGSLLRAIAAFVGYISGVITFFSGIVWIILWVIEYEKLERIAHVCKGAGSVCLICILVIFFSAILPD